MRKLLFILLIFVCKVSFAITPVFTCGAECGVTISPGHFVLNGTSSISTSTKRNGDRAFRVNPTAAGNSYFTYTGASNAVSTVRFYINYATLPSSNALIYFYNTGGTVPCVAFNSSDSKIYPATLTGTDTYTFGSTGATITTGIWYRIDVKIDGTSDPTTIDVSVDGTTLTQLTRTGTSSSSINAFGQFSSSVKTYDLFIDDLIFSNTSGDYPIGKGKVEHYIPVSDGTHAAGITANDFERTLTGTDIIASTTDSYLLLNDVPLESGSSVDWINMIAPVLNTYTENIFGPAPGISTPTVAPRMVSLIAGIHHAGTGAGNMRLDWNDNGTTASIYTASAVAGVTTIIYKTANLADPPSAASAWTLSGNGNFNDIRIRFDATGTVDANPDQYFDCAMIEAEFDEVELTIPGTPSDKRHTTLGVGMAKIENIFKEKFVKK